MKRETFERLTKPKDLEAWRERKRQELLAESRVNGSAMNGTNTGLFAQVLPNCVGEPFKEIPDFRKSVSAAATRKKEIGEEEEEEPLPPFKAGGKVQKSDKGCFSPLVSLAVDDPYLDPSARTRKLRRQRRRKPKLVQERPFNPGGVIVRENDVKPVYNRTDATMPKEKIEEILKLVKQERQQASAEIRQRIRDSEGARSLRNFVTAPVKKGTFGFNGLLFADSPEWKHTLEYVPQGDSAIPSRVAPKRSVRSSDSLEERKPFRSGGRSNMCFSSNQDIYGSTRQRRPSTAPRARTRKEQVEAARKNLYSEDQPPFRPSNPVAKDKYINYPEYMHYHPGVPREKQEAQQRKLRKNRRPSSASVGSQGSTNERPKWVPNNTTSSYFVRSIALNHKNLGWK